MSYRMYASLLTPPALWATSPLRGRAIAYDVIPSSRAERSEVEGPLLATARRGVAQQNRSLDFVRFAHFARDDGGCCHLRPP